MRKILYLTGTRAEFGLIKNTLREFKSNKSLDLKLVVTGMHLMPEFGESVKEIKHEGFDFTKFNVEPRGDSTSSTTEFIGRVILKLSDFVKAENPDIILVLGDRPEMLAVALVGSYSNIPVAHIHGGEKTETVDELARHAITKLSHVHLAATEKSKERIIKMGEDKWRVFLVGAPGLDQIKELKLLSKKTVLKSLGFNIDKPFIILLQHSVSSQLNNAADQIKKTLSAIEDLGYQALIVYPNVDPGGRSMINEIQKYENKSQVRIFKNIDHDNFIKYLSSADALVGNSSSGLIEAPSLKVPALNIGIRQQGRERTDNVVDVDHDKDLIIKGLRKVVAPGFKKTLSGFNPYGSGNTGRKISKILSEIRLSKRLLEKQIRY